MLKLPKLGLRNISTAVGVFIDYISFLIMGRDDAFYACIATIVTTQINVDESIKAGKARLLGTVLGGILGFIFTNISIFFHNRLDPVIIPIAISLSIYLCTFLKRPASAQICSIVLLSVLMGDKSENVSVYLHVLNRVFGTLYGVIVAVLVEMFVWKYLKNEVSISPPPDESH